MEAAKGSATVVVQPGAAVEAGLGGKVRQLGQRRWRRRICLLCTIIKAWEAERLRALNGVLSVELQPEGLLLEAVEAPWKEVSNEESQ